MIRRMQMPKLLSIASILIATTLCTGSYGQFVLVSDTRTSTINTELMDDVDGDSDYAQESAALFQPYDSHLKGSASYAGVQSQCFATQASFTTPNAIAIACDTYAEITPLSLGFRF